MTESDAGIRLGARSLEAQPLCVAPGSFSSLGRAVSRTALMFVVVASALWSPLSLAGQTTVQGAVTAAGERYRAGALRRLILGRHYRDLWTTPIQVELLDLESFAGGLEPLRTGGGQQTRSLRFAGADGREWAFRSVDKDPSPVLDSLLRGTVVDDLVQDGISAAHPYGALVAGPLLDAAGILHVDPQLYLMPDDPALGEFREEFAGMLGLIEERPDENSGAGAPFRGAERVIGSERLVERLDDGPDDRVDARAYLTARMMDVLLGDWDRHRGQWRWATYDDGDTRSWLPVPSDRDQAFSKFDGAATRIVSLYMPQFVRFDEEYPSLKRLHWNGRAIDRWFLAELDRPVWDSIASSIQAALTDDVIREAVLRLPPEIYQVPTGSGPHGEELQAALRSRRDLLDEAWDEFYRLISSKVDVQATDADEVVLVEREDGTLLISIAAPEESDAPYFVRRFVRGETSEVRLHLKDGDDSVLVRGDADTGIQLRLIGGEGDDRFEFEGGGSGVRVYDYEGDDETLGEAAPDVNRKPFEEWIWSEEDRNQPQDWGSWTYPLFSTSYSTDLGPFLGGGVRVERFGFRKRPYSASWNIRGGYAPTLQKARIEIDGRFHIENSSMFWTLGARMSRLDVLHYYGLGNQSTAGGRTFHAVDITSTSARLGLGISPSPAFEWTVGVTLERSSTEDNVGAFFETLGPVYGSGVFYEVGLGTELTVDPLSGASHTGNRFRLRLHGTVVPEAFDVQRTFGRAGGEVSTLLASSPWPAMSLGVRAGGEQVFGQFPWHEAAFMGGTGTVRGFDEQRFAGDASVYASGELRLRAWRPRIVVPVGVGVFGFVDAGRVYLDGDSAGGWSTAAGGGVYLQPVSQPYLVRLGAASSSEATKIFVALGLPY